jgi:hypothetical protein
MQPGGGRGQDNRTRDSRLYDCHGCGGDGRGH